MITKNKVKEVINKKMDRMKLSHLHELLFMCDVITDEKADYTITGYELPLKKARREDEKTLSRL